VVRMLFSVAGGGLGVLDGFLGQMLKLSAW
jgi:hypothetical protein